MNKRGTLVVLSAPSGGGKSTIIKELLRRRPDFVYSVSCTTRPKRDYEVDGVHYHFIPQEEFVARASAGSFLEWEEVHGDYYGTDRQEIEDALQRGSSVLLDIDVNGGEHVQELFPDSVLIFIYPPSVEALRERLVRRGADSPEGIERRLSRYPMEKAKGDCYPNRVVNDQIELAVQQVLKIIDDNS